MERALDKYNIHKRQTLERITSVYSRQGIAIIKSFYIANAQAIFDSLEEDSKFTPKLPGFDKKFEKLLGDHFKKVITVGVSDGYREVTPDNRLGTWLDYGLMMPVENTIPITLAKYRDSLADKIDKTIGDRKPKTFLEVIGFTKDQQLDYLKQTHSDLLKHWLNGKSTIVEVKKALEVTLRKSASSVERVFRTETTRWFNEARADYFESETTASHVQIFAVTDGRTSHICESRNGFVVPIDEAREKKYMPPFHPNCRTVQRALFENLASHKRLIEKGMAMNENRFADLPKGWD